MQRLIFIHEIFACEHLCVIIVSCQSFNLWIKYPKPSPTWCNEILRCNDSFAFCEVNVSNFWFHNFHDWRWHGHKVQPLLVCIFQHFFASCSLNKLIPSKGTIELLCLSKTPTSSIGCTPSSMVLIKPISMTLSSPLASPSSSPNLTHPRYA